MSSSIGSVGELVAVIRSQLAVRPGGAAPEPVRARPVKGSPAGSRYSDSRLAGLIEVRVRQIDRDEPQRGRKAFRVFLEAVLLAHFGEELVNDPRFFQMVDEVQGALEADAACKAMIDTAIAHLLSAQP